MRTAMLLSTLLLAFPSCSLPAAGERVAVPGDPPTPRNVAILVYDGVELLDFSGPGEVFSAAHGPSGPAFHVFTVAKTKAPVKSQGFVGITPEFSIADCPAPDIVVVPGGNIPDEDKELQAWVKRCSGSSELVMSVCNGAFLLAESGLLDGLEATTHHGSIEALMTTYPKTRVYTNRRFVDSGKVMTCAGVSAGIDGALHVVERLLGKEAAHNTARYMEYDWRPEEIAKQLAEPGQTPGPGEGAQLAETALAKGAEAALAQYRAMASPPGENELNQSGYLLLGAHKEKAARALFELVVAAFPSSANALDSLAEACEALGDSKAAIGYSEATLTKVKAADIPAEKAAVLHNVAASRVVRLGKGDKSGLRFGCPPCGGCDAPRYLEAGPCPRCHMEMTAGKSEE